MSLATALIEEAHLLGIEIEAAGPDLVLRPARNVPAWLVDQVRAAKPDIIRELRHRQALRLLNEHPEERRAFVVDDPDSDPDHVTVTVAVRGIAVFDMEIPRAKWCPFSFMKFLEAREQ